MNRLLQFLRLCMQIPWFSKKACNGFMFRINTFSIITLNRYGDCFDRNPLSDQPPVAHTSSFCPELLWITNQPDVLLMARFHYLQVSVYWEVAERATELALIYQWRHQCQHQHFFLLNLLSSNQLNAFGDRGKVAILVAVFAENFFGEVKRDSKPEQLCLTASTNSSDYAWTKFSSFPIHNS